MLRNSAQNSPKRRQRKTKLNEEQNITDGIKQMQNKIYGLDQRISNLINEIARKQNKIEEKRAGYKSKLNRKKNDLKEHYKSSLELLQSQTATQLAENESLAEKISKKAEEIDSIINTPVKLPTAKTNFDFSNKTEKIIESRREVIQKQCNEEFMPLFQEIQEKHEDNVSVLEMEHEREIQKLHEDAALELRRFKPRVFISQEEYNTTKFYEKEQQEENKSYEAQKEKLNKEIAAINKAKESALQEIFNNTKVRLTEEKKNFAVRIKSVKSALKEKKKQIPTFKIDIKIDSEQENKLRASAEEGMKNEFGEKLKANVTKVQDNRDKMKLDIKNATEDEIKLQTEENEEEISCINNEISEMDKKIEEMNSELKTLRSNYNKQGDDRRQNEENLSQERGEKYYYGDKLKEIERKLAKYDIQEEEEEESPELIAIQNDLEQLSQHITQSKSAHHKAMKKLEMKHKSAKMQIEERFKALEEAKTEQIKQLKRQIKDTNAKVKAMGAEINDLINQFD